MEENVLIVDIEMILKEIENNKCENPEHNPLDPSFYSYYLLLNAGIYEWKCPGCGQKTVFKITENMIKKIRNMIKLCQMKQ